MKSKTKDAQSKAPKGKSASRKSASRKSASRKSASRKSASRKSASRKSASHKSASHKSASQLIDARIRELGDWRGELLSRLRTLIKQADPEAIEEWKWRGTPVWSHDGLICTGETYKSVVKMTFAKGASLKDPSRLFNSSLEGNVRRAIDFHEGDRVDEEALKALIRAAVILNTSSARSRAKPTRRMTRAKD
jgi:hypothetical protein